jgi:hypothetical protein
MRFRGRFNLDCGVPVLRPFLISMPLAAIAGLLLARIDASYTTGVLVGGCITVVALLFRRK